LCIAHELEYAVFSSPIFFKDVEIFNGVTFLWSKENILRKIKSM